MLLPGDDLLALAEAAVAGGADLIGMAGGDGSQALVASVASRHGIPFVVVPAGTRNHFARDLGVDREDVPGSLAAFRDGVDVTVDLAEVNGRVFVNNAVDGLYATIVQSRCLPRGQGPHGRHHAARPGRPDGRAVGRALHAPLREERPAGQVLLVSNNPYDLHHLRGASRRARLDRGVLGAVSVTVSSATDAETLTALELAGRVSQFGGWQEWNAPEIEVRSSRPVEIGVDGEALLLEPPLRFASRPAALTVRLPRSALTRAQRESPVRVTERSTLVALWQIAVGAGRSA